MGMSASQARMLSLTARMSDLELQAQEISNAKIRLADQSEQASRAYSDALDKQKMTVFSGLQSNGSTSYMDASAYNLTTYGAVSTTDKQRFIKDASGRVLVMSSVQTAYDNAAGDLTAFLTAIGCGTDAAKTSYYTNLFNEIKDTGSNSPGDVNMQSAEWLQNEITAGNIFLSEYDPEAGTGGTGDFVNVSWTSGDASLQEKTDKTETAKAEADYNTTMASIQSKDKRFDMQLTEINTEHSAIQTEIDSVKKVIDKNIERSFKIFDA